MRVAKRKTDVNQRLYKQLRERGYCLKGITSEEFRAVMRIAETKAGFDERCELAYSFIKAHGEGLEKCCYDNSPDY